VKLVVPVALRRVLVLAVPVAGVEAGMTVVAQEKLVEAGMVLPDGTEEHCCVPLVEAVRNDVPVPIVLVGLLRLAVKPAKAVCEPTRTITVKKAAMMLATTAFLTVIMRFYLSVLMQVIMMRMPR
jgi:hypothetical protein